MTTREYNISGLDLGRTLDRARTIAARAERKGLSGGYTITTRTEQSEPDAFGVIREKTYLVVEGDAPRFEGWTFVAKVEYVNGQPVVTGSPFYEGPAVDRSTLSPNSCDHCGINVRRTKTVVVERDGERKQVGTSCLKDFLGHDFPASWGRDPFAEFDDDERAGSRGRYLLPVEATLTAAAQIIRQAGFVRSGEADSTRQNAAALLSLRSVEEKYLADKRFGAATDEDRATAREALEFGRTMAPTSDYVLNLQAVIGEDVFDADRFLGLVVSLVSVFLRSKGDEAQAKAEKEQITEALYAEPKTKVEFAEAKVGRIFGFETAYGYSEIVTFVADGYRFKWFTKAAPEFLEPGMTVSLKGTVKEADEYQGQVSTKLLRCKVEQVAA